MSLVIPNNLVSVDWLFDNLNDNNLIIFDATIQKVTSSKTISSVKEQIKNAHFFDIKNIFSDVNARLPNTVLSPEEFQEKARELGVNNNSCVIVYDDLGIYSSPRVWWLFQLMGFKNIAVLNGGFPSWKAKKYPIDIESEQTIKKGNFKTNYLPNKIAFTEEVLSATISDEFLIIDARSSGRFFGTESEPRNDVKSGHIPNSVNLPYSKLLKNGELKSTFKIKEIFSEINPENRKMIFTCGSGITATILELAANLTGYKITTVYDGSWTEWGSSENLPIEI